MSLYNALFGHNPFAGVLLQMIGVDPNSVPRFRDCFLDDEGTYIIVYTRTGGGNRDYYDKPDKDSDYSGPWNSDLRAIAGYMSDEDDDFDCTYAIFKFVIPEPCKPLVLMLKDLGAVSNPKERWQTVLNDLRKGDQSKPEVQRALKVGESIMKQINELDGEK